jgi:hypothetical protein
MTSAYCVARRGPAGDDETAGEDYVVDAGDAAVRPLPATPRERVAVTQAITSIPCA